MMRRLTTVGCRGAWDGACDPAADDRRIISRNIGDEERHGRSAVEARRQAAPLQTRDGAPPRIQHGNVLATRQARSIETLEVVEVMAGCQHLHQTGRAAGDQQHGQHIGRYLRDECA